MRTRFLRWYWVPALLLVLLIMLVVARVFWAVHRVNSVESSLGRYGRVEFGYKGESYGWKIETAMVDIIRRQPPHWLDHKITDVAFFPVNDLTVYNLVGVKRDFADNISSFPQLRRLKIDEDSVVFTAEDWEDLFEKLNRLPHLEELEIRALNASPQSLAPFKGHPALKKVILTWPQKPYDEEAYQGTLPDVDFEMKEEWSY